MKANELRIGNLVNRKYFNSQPNNEHWGLEPVEIVSLFFGKYNVKLKNGGHSVIDYVEQIPLTEEWLIRLGFEKKQKTPALTVFNKDNFQVRFDPLDKFQFYINGRYLNLNYVHQLQNLYFARTNNELICTSK